MKNNNDPKNLGAGAEQILYSLAGLGILKPEYAILINRPEDFSDEKLIKAKEDIMHSLELFFEEIELYGAILG